MASPVDVIIFFVGLTLWSEKLPNDYGVKAILPRVVDKPHIENHTAALIFRKDSFVAQSGWKKVKELPRRDPASATEPVYQYVPLDADTVRFLTKGTNDRPSLAGMKLSRLGNLCPAILNLRADFRAPSYPGAAAVVALPEGKVRACLSVPAESQGRLDTRLDLKTTGELVVVTTTPGLIPFFHRKLLRLKQQCGKPIELIVANLPASYYEKVMTMTDRVRIDSTHLPHSIAYVDMGESSGPSCTPNLQNWWDHLDPEGIPLCSASAGFALPSMPPDVTLSLAENNPDLISPSGVNYECSNTQWP